MIVSNAPSVRARRILIALLAFAMAAAFVFVASIAPADAAKDEKFYSPTTDPADGNVGSSVVVRFTNIDDTSTQSAGSFSVDFDDDFIGLGATINGTSSGESWSVLSTAGNTVVISALSNSDRIPTNGGWVEVEVSWDSVPSGDYLLETDGDQQIGGTFKGGNRFTLGPTASHPTIHVVSCGQPNCVSVTTATYSAVVGCEEQCTAFEPENLGLPEGQYEIQVDFSVKGLIVVELTTTDGNAVNPGAAFVQVSFDEGETFTDMDQCGVSGSPPQTNCFHVNRHPPGKNLQYLIIFEDDDIIFKFR